MAFSHGMMIESDVLNVASRSKTKMSSAFVKAIISFVVDHVL